MKIDFVEINRQEMIEKITDELVNTNISFNLDIDVYEDMDEDDMESTIEDAKCQIDDLMDDFNGIKKELESKKKQLSKLLVHELEEKGEELGLWKCKEKQKRLI